MTELFEESDTHITCDMADTYYEIHLPDKDEKYEAVAEHEPIWRSCPKCGKQYNVPYNFYQYCPEEISEINTTSKYTEHEKKLGYNGILFFLMPNQGKLNNGTCDYGVTKEDLKSSERIAEIHTKYISAYHMCESCAYGKEPDKISDDDLCIAQMLDDTRCKHQIHFNGKCAEHMIEDFRENRLFWQHQTIIVEKNAEKFV
jgi:hypothetical protein